MIYDMIRKNEVVIRKVPSSIGVKTDDWVKKRNEFQKLYESAKTIVYNKTEEAHPKIVPVRTKCNKYIGMRTVLKSAKNRVELNILKNQKTGQFQYVIEDGIVRQNTPFEFFADLAVNQLLNDEFKMELN